MKPSRSQRKMLFCTVMLALTCALWLCGPKPWQWWALGAIACSWLADGLLAKYPPPLNRVPQGFFVGASLFAMAHLCYGAASMMVLRSLGAPFRWRNFALVAAAFALAVLAHRVIFARRSQRGRGFTIAACAYLMLVGVMASLTFRVAAETVWRVWCLPLGACLFFLSDCILVVREYRRARSRPLSFAIMASYLAGQLFLQLGLWLC